MPRWGSLKPRNSPRRQPRLPIPLVGSHPDLHIAGSVAYKTKSADRSDSVSVAAPVCVEVVVGGIVGDGVRMTSVRPDDPDRRAVERAAVGRVGAFAALKCDLVTFWAPHREEIVVRVPTWPCDAAQAVTVRVNHVDARQTGELVVRKRDPSPVGRPAIPERLQALRVRDRPEVGAVGVDRGQPRRVRAELLGEDDVPAVG
jgi:hypothetical protein